MTATRLLIFLLFFASGASGLIYEVVWVRQFGLLFGSTVYSAALVGGIYMCGLGLGSFFAGRWIDRRFHENPALPVRAYGVFELGIAGLAVAILLALPYVAELVAQASSYVEGEQGWLRLSFASSLLRYGSAVTMLLPITLLMGGTLTLLIRHLVGNDLAGASWHVGALYGVNTAGAALGCLLTDTTLVPWLGVRDTQLLAAGLNIFAAAGALLLVRAVPSPGTATAPPPVAVANSDARVGWASLAIALSGFSAMALQILWFRHLISLFGAYRPVFSILLSVILVGIWLGSLLGGSLARRTGRPGTLFIMALALFVVWSLGALWTVEAENEWLQTQLRAYSEMGPLPFYVYLLRSAAWAVGPPALLSGMAYPLANALVQRAEAHVGERAGLLYLANTVGGVVGSLSAGFLLLPAFGIQTTAALAVGCSTLATVAVFFAARGLEPAAPIPRLVAVALSVVALVTWARLPERSLLLRSLPKAVQAGKADVLAVREGVNETIAVSDTNGELMTLITNGHSMSSTHFGSQRYMRAYVHVPMFISPAIKDVMIMCFGVGNTTNATLLYPQVERLDVVDLSPDVLEHSKYFEKVNGLPLEDPRVKVHVNDARQHLRMTPEDHYDLITGEPPPIAYAGVSSLYSQEFFEIARSRLRPGGFLTYWLPIQQVGEAAALATVAAFAEAFPGAVLLDGFRHELMLVGRKDAPLEFDPVRMRELIDATPGLRKELRWISLDQPFEVAAMLAATPPVIQKATAGHPPATDDHPVLEYGAWMLGTDRRVPADLFSLEEVGTWCPNCFEGGLDEDELADLEGAIEITSAYYKSSHFLNHFDRNAGARPILSESGRRVVNRSFYLQQIAGRGRLFYRNAADQVRHGKTRAAVRSLENLLRRFPRALAARIDLADLYVELGRPEKARQHLEAARGVAPDDRLVEAAWQRFQKQSPES